MEYKWNEYWKNIIDVEVVYNLPSKMLIYLYSKIPSKKNNRNNFKWISLPNRNYVFRNKKITNKLKWREWLYNVFPCKITITSIAWDMRKSDIDNQTTSILDTFTDLGIIPDDNKFVVQELNVRNLGYIKNCFLTKVLIEPYNLPQLFDSKKDYKNVDLDEAKQIFNDLPYA